MSQYFIQGDSKKKSEFNVKIHDNSEDYSIDFLGDDDFKFIDD